MLNNLSSMKAYMHTEFKSESENALMASMKVSYNIECEGEADTIREKLILHCAIDLAACMIDEEAARKIQLVPLSNNTIQRRIQDCASNVLDELVRRLRLSESFTVLLGESTDDVNLAILLVFVWYVYEGEFQEDLLLCKSIEAQITGEDIFQILDQLFINHQIDWNKCIDVCTDGAKSMTGKTVGVVARIKTLSKMCKSSHYILHRHALIVKRMPNSLKSVLDNAVQIVNFFEA
jgi:hypothetical protein